MGININNYGVYGVKINDYNSEMSELDEKLYELNNQGIHFVDVIADGMMGEYIIFGQKFWDSGDWRYGAEDGQSLGILDPDSESLQKIRELIINGFQEHLPNYVHLVNDHKQWQIMALTHYH